MIKPLYVKVHTMIRPICNNINRHMNNLFPEKGEFRKDVQTLEFIQHLFSFNFNSISKSYWHGLE